MMKRFLAMTSLLCVASASTAAAEDILPSFSTLDNDSMKVKFQDYTEEVTQTDLPKEFTTILPELPYVNSCTYPGTCAALNDTGSCQRCQVGFVKDSKDGTKCKYANEEEGAFLLTTSGQNFKLISLDTNKSTPILQNEELNTRGVDFSFRTNKIFWFGITDSTIYTATLLNNVDSKIKTAMQDNLVHIREVTVDWIYNHLYWVDTQRHFAVSNFNTTMKKVLFKVGVSSYPIAIFVHPLSGWMYWTDWLKNCIERVGLDGSHREVILDTDIYHPQSLALDFVENRLYWYQGLLHDCSIWSSAFDGSDKILVFETTRGSQLPFINIRGIALLDKHIYLMDFGASVIYKINKCNGQELQMIYNLTGGLLNIKMVHSTVQPDGENLCSERSDQCSHFCLPAPSPGKDGSVSATTCACPNGMYLSSDQQTCALESALQKIDVYSCAYPGTCGSLTATGNCTKCKDGYAKDPKNDKKCIHGNEDEGAFLIVSSYGNLRFISLDTKNPTQMMQNGKFSDSQDIDYNFRTNTIFWFSRENRTIHSAPLLNDVDSEKQDTMQYNSSRVFAITVDWIYNHIYWVDRDISAICVSNFNGTMKKVLIDDELGWPFSIVVNPLIGWLYWADSWYNQITRTSLDGSRKEIILDIDIYHPRGLALDFVEN